MNDDFFDEKLLAIEDKRAVPWFADYVNYLVTKVTHQNLAINRKRGSSHT